MPERPWPVCDHCGTERRTRRRRVWRFNKVTQEWGVTNLCHPNVGPDCYTLVTQGIEQLGSRKVPVLNQGKSTTEKDENTVTDRNIEMFTDVDTMAAYEKNSALTEMILPTYIPEESIPVIYNALALAGEAGEIAGKVSKAIRDSGGHINHDLRMDLLKESGDTLWHLVRLIAALRGDFRSVARANLLKLKSRMERGVLSGSGDDR